MHWRLFDPLRVRRLAERLAGLGVERFAVQLARPGQMLDMSLGAAPTPDEADELWAYLGQLFRRFELREA
ncbi:hypothetical protein D9M68_662070 [compost metagenome]